VFVLPISNFKLKVLHPPDSYFQEVHKMICDFLWDGKRHQVKPLSVYLPVETGGLGIKNNFVQYLIFKQRAILKGITVNDTSYFLRNPRHLAYDFHFNNKKNWCKLQPITGCFNVLKFKFKKSPKTILITLA